MYGRLYIWCKTDEPASLYRAHLPWCIVIWNYEKFVYHIFWRFSMCNGSLKNYAAIIPKYNSSLIFFWLIAEFGFIPNSSKNRSNSKTLLYSVLVLFIEKFSFEHFSFIHYGETAKFQSPFSFSCTSRPKATCAVSGFPWFINITWIECYCQNRR